MSIKLHAAENSFIPLGDAATSTLPSQQSIVDQALGLFNNE